MKKILRFNQGPYAGQDVEVDEDEATIQNYLDTGFCSEAEAKAPEPEKVAPKERAPRTPDPEPAAEVKPKKKTVRRPRKKKKIETPEG